MAGAAPKIDGDSPNFEPESCTINCPHSVLLEIRAAVLESFNNLPHGGSEIFGVLFGKREGSDLRVVALRALSSSLSSSSELSPEDRARFNAALTAPPVQGELHEAVGWFRAHPRTALELSLRDIEIFNGLFSQPWQVAMVMRPGNSAATRVRFYLRESNGAVGAKYQELTLPAPLDRARPTSGQALVWETAPPSAAEVPEPPQADSDGQASYDAQEAGIANLRDAVSSDDAHDSRAPKLREKVLSKFAPLFEPGAALERAAADRRYQSNFPWPNFPWRAAVVLPLILIAGVALGAGLYWLIRQPAQLALQLADAQGQLHVAWNRNATSIEPGERAHLDIVDGNSKVWLELTPEQLRNGSVTYSRQSNDISVRLKIERPGKATLEESARFLGSAQSVSAASNVETLQRELIASRERLDQLLQNRPPEQALAPRKTPELMVNVPVAKVPSKDLPASNVPPKASLAKNDTARAVAAQAESVKNLPLSPVDPEQSGNQAPRSVVSLSTAAGKAPANELAPPPTVAQLTPPVTVPHANQPAVIEQHNLPAPPIEKPVAPALKTEAHASPPPPTVAPAASGPRSGRIIWTGRVQKNGTIAIDGKNSSTGTFSGELPAKPVRLSVSPGDLSTDGIVLYSSNMQYANSVLEPASQQNGWNKTVYTYNPRLANDIIVVETPDAKNGWNRLVLRNKNPKISVIVIDWALIN